ncbi:hypothetical protein [Actinophytocola sp. NPDC049390]|uniref:hypothetical protein n=1 Tax=Actinophytocola sp. NPDC049390 TaxID=3363894 RepID=UPI0037BAF1A7
MTPDAARELLLFHSGAHPDVHDPRWKQGFLGMLRPYRGLHEENFHSVMACLRALADDLQGDVVDRGAVGALWGICHFGRAWGTWPGGMLRGNNLITDEDVSRLESWIEQISYSTFCVLDGAIDEAFDGYDRGV